jgi:outer membrane protein OmpA-like peptidoglycan-associated protein
MFSRRGSCLGFLLVFLMSFFPVSPAPGADIKGGKDSPLLRRYEGSFIVQYSAKEYDVTVIPLGKTEYRGDRYVFTASEKAEGRTARLLYVAPAGRSALEVFRNYEWELKEKGYEILFSGSKDELGPYDSFAETLYGRDRQYPIPGDERTKNQQFLSARLVRTEGNVYVTVCAFENNFWGSETKMEKGRTYCRVDMVETKPMETKMVTVTSEEMARGLESSGKIALYGIYFDTDKADVKPESKAALEEMAKLLKTFPDLRVLVVGHTDSTGDREYNMGLSRRRAEAVVKSLRESYGIAASRLVPAGVGMLAPVASNRTEEGRAKNRRVELVEMQPSLQ